MLDRLVSRKVRLCHVMKDRAEAVSTARPLVLATISFALSFAAWGLVGGLATIFSSLYSLTASRTALLV